MHSYFVVASAIELRGVPDEPELHLGHPEVTIPVHDRPPRIDDLRQSRDEGDNGAYLGLAGDNIISPRTKMPT